MFTLWRFLISYQAVSLRRVIQPGHHSECLFGQSQILTRSCRALPWLLVSQALPFWAKCTVCPPAISSQQLYINILLQRVAYRSKDPRTDDIGEGLSPLQVTLDQAAHLMDAMAFGYIDGSLCCLQKNTFFFLLPDISVFFLRRVGGFLGSYRWQVWERRLPRDGCLHKSMSRE